MKNILICMSLCTIFFSGSLIAGENNDIWKKGELLASEDFASGMSDWLAEGDVSARVVDGKLRFEALEETEVTKGNVWWKKQFQGPILIEYEYQSLTPFGLSMFWWNAQNRNGSDLLTKTRSGKYDDYVVGEMNGYHLSYHRFNSGVSNLRKSYGFHLLASRVDPIPQYDLAPHKIQIYYDGKGGIRTVFDGVPYHEYMDAGGQCISPEKWSHKNPCPGTGEPLTEGKIGFRHTQRQAALYDNVKVYRLVKS